MKKQIILNWKLEKNYAQAVSWVKENLEELKKLSSKVDITILPSYESIDALSQLVKNSEIKIGSQGCAQVISGPTVGEVSVKSLQDLKCNSCLVNHCGQPGYKACNQDSDNLEASIKTKLLLDHNIEPIFCLGESYEQATGEIRFRILENRLKNLDNIINNASFKDITIVYEPLWAIGTDSGNPAQDANIVFEWLWQYAKTNWKNAKVKLIYGGGITDSNVQSYQAIEHLDGLILGKASLDFKNLKKIVELYREPA